MLLLGTFPMTVFNSKTSLALISLCYALRMVGVSFTMMTTFTAGINVVEPQMTAHANAGSSTVRQIGGSLGTALSMLVISLCASGTSNAETANLTVAYRWGFVLMLTFAIIGFLGSFILPSAQKELRK